MSTITHILTILKHKGSYMKISAHAAQRFLQRVMKKTDYTCLDVDFAIRFLENLLEDVVPRSRSMRFILPSFENYQIIYRDNTVVTIIPKGERYV